MPCSALEAATRFASDLRNTGVVGVSFTMRMRRTPSYKKLETLEVLPVISKQELAPNDDARPEGQGLHKDTLRSMAEYEPGKQTSQNATPGLLPAVPGGHAWQVVFCPTEPSKEP